MCPICHSEAKPVLTSKENPIFLLGWKCGKAYVCPGCGYKYGDFHAPPEGTPLYLVVLAGVFFLLMIMLIIIVLR